MDNCEIKPCPFCGGEAYYRTPQHEKGTAFDVCMIECKQCGATPYGISVYENETDENKKASIARFWNRRAEMIKAEDFIAIEQYKKYGRIISCGECKYWKSTGDGYGRCERGANKATGLTCKEDEYCSKAEKKPVEDPLIPKDAGDRDYSGLLDE